MLRPSLNHGTLWLHIDDDQIDPNQGIKRNKNPSFSFLSLMWTCFDTQNFKRPTNCFIFGMVKVFCKLAPKQIVTYDTMCRCLLNNIILWAVIGLFKWLTEYEIVYNFCDFCELLLLFFVSLFHKMFCFVYFFLYTLHPYLPVICTHYTPTFQLSVHITPLPSSYLYTLHPYLPVICTHYTLTFQLSVHITPLPSSYLYTLHPYLPVICTHYTPTVQLSVHI